MNGLNQTLDAFTNFHKLSQGNFVFLQRGFRELIGTWTPSNLLKRCGMMGPGCRIATHKRLPLRQEGDLCSKRSERWMNSQLKNFSRMDRDFGFDSHLHYKDFSHCKPAVPIIFGCHHSPALAAWWGCCRPPLKEVPEGDWNSVLTEEEWATKSTPQGTLGNFRDIEWHWDI